MNTIKKIALFFVLFLLQDVLLAQTSNVTGSTLVNQAVTEDIQTKQTLPDNTLIAPAGVSEPIPTPEQQGFTKVLVDEKPVYIKKVDGVTIEYKPEQN